MAKPKQIQSIFVSRRCAAKDGADGNTMIDIAIITENGSYVEYEMRWVKDVMTFDVAKRIRMFFTDYRFTPKTDLCVMDIMQEKEPLYEYFQFLAQQIGFKIHRVNLDKITARLKSQIPRITIVNERDLDEKSPNAASIRLNRIWQNMVSRGRCRWISKQYDQHLQTVSSYIRKHKKILRVGAYYQALKLWKRNADQRYWARRDSAELPA